MADTNSVTDGVLSITSIIITGTAGDGGLSILPQASAVPTPISGITQYTDNSNNIAYKMDDGFVRTLAIPATADTTYTIPNNGGNANIVTTLGNSTISGTLAATNLTGTNSGDVTMGTLAVGTSPAGALITGQSLSLQIASGTQPGLLTATAQAIGGAKTFTDDIIPNANIDLSTTTATVGNINVAAVRFIHSFGTSNIFIGRPAGNYTLTGTQNTCYGNTSGQALTTGATNVCFGHAAGAALTSGTSNVAVGAGAGVTLNTGGSNTFIGTSAGSAVTTGGNNILIGNVVGTTALANTTTVGSTQTSVFVAGVRNNTIVDANMPQIVVCDPTNNRIMSSIALPIVTIPTFCSLSADGANIQGYNAAYVSRTTTVAGNKLVFTQAINVTRIGKMVFVEVPSFLVNATAASASPTAYRFTAYSPALPTPGASGRGYSTAIGVLVGASTTVVSGWITTTLTGELVIYRGSGGAMTIGAPGSGMPTPIIFVYESA